MALFDSLKKLLGRDLTPEEETQIKAEIETKPAPAPAPSSTPTPSPSPTPSPAPTDSVEAMKNQLADVRKMLEEEREARLAAERASADQATADKTAKILQKLEEYKKNGLIPPDNKEREAHFKSLLEMDFENATKTLDPFAPKPTDTKPNQTPAPAPTGSAKSDYASLRESALAVFEQSK